MLGVMADDKPKDTVRIKGVCPKGHTHVERRRGDKVETGVLSNMEEGKPIPEGSEYVELKARGDEPGLYDVTLSHKGPVRASTPAYRKGYDRIFGGRDKSMVN
jgi:hypothetical protein